MRRTTLTADTQTGREMIFTLSEVLGYPPESFRSVVCTVDDDYDPPKITLEPTIVIVTEVDCIAIAASVIEKAPAQ